MVQRAESLAKTVGVRQACTTLGVPRISFYQARRAASKPLVSAQPAPAPRHPREFSTAEKKNIRAKLNSARFVDQAPRTVYATLLNEECYLCHWRTMYRVLAKCNEGRERRNQLRHPPRPKPELLATAPNQVCSWDITKLLGRSSGATTICTSCSTC